MMKVEIRVEGIKEVQDILGRVAPKQATNIMRSTIHGMAGEVRSEAKKHVPVDQGVLKKSIKTKRERVRFGVIHSTVRVLPDAFYWRFVEYGTLGRSEAAMFMKAVENLNAKKEQIFREMFTKKFEQAIARAARRSNK